MNQGIIDYNNNQADPQKVLCELLSAEIYKHFSSSNAENKVWHGGPVWFLEDNPIVGYWVRKNCVQLLFWSGQSFDEPNLQPEGSFKAAEVRYTEPKQINTQDLKRWLDKSERIQWDYKNIIKRKGVLKRLK